MAYITNDGSRLIERARTEGKSIVFGSVRMNTIYKSDPYSLVQQTDEWFGENHGSVVGCISHVSVDEVSQVCDSKLAVQCNDNSESWKSLGIYAHLDGEVDEILFACESIENGEYKDVTIVELPVTLYDVVADFGLSEGGSGSGGGGKVPDTAFGRGWVEEFEGRTLHVFGHPIHPNSNIDKDGLRFTFDSSGYLSSVCPDTGGVVVTIGVIVKDAEDNMVENGRVSGFSSGTETPLTFQSPIQLAAGYAITYQTIFSSL